MQPLEIKNLSFTYPNSDKPTLTNINLTISPGEWVAIMGPSGSGKSTVLLSSSGLLPATADALFLNEINIQQATEKQLTLLRRRKLGYIFQDFNLVPALTVAQNIALPFVLDKIKIDSTRISESLHQVGLNELENKLPHELSGGQQQRVAIARALITNPAIVFADEPTGALDTESGEQVLQLFEKLIDQQSSILMVTHDPKVAARAHRIIWVVDGQIVSTLQGGTPSQIAQQLATLGEAK